MQGFPAHILPDCSSVLSLFSAAFLGLNDVQFVHKAGIKDCHMVDINEKKLEQMQRLFSYDYTCGDAFEFIRKCKCKYDLVISDQFAGMDDRLWSLYDKLKLISNKYLVVGVSRDNYMKSHLLPNGELYQRSNNYGGVFWHMTKL